MSIDVHLPEPINWERVLDEASTPGLRGSPSEKGIQFHEWLEEQYRGSLDFERELEWLNSEEEWVQGRYDCSDGFYIYEFKTVDGIPDHVYSAHEEQLENYLEGADSDFGFVVYIDRGSWDVEQYEVKRDVF